MACMRATVDYWLDTDGREDLAGLVNDVLGTLTPPNAGPAVPPKNP
jgi:hypothetical protein